MPCWSAYYVTPRHAVPPSSPMGGRAISIFFQFIQFLETATASGEGCVVPISSFHLFADSAKYPAGRLRSPPTACLPSSSAPPPPGSRCDRPVSAKPIGKQRPKMYFPVSFPSSTSKHSNRSRKNAVRPQFLFTTTFSSFRLPSSAAKI